MNNTSMGLDPSMMGAMGGAMGAMDPMMMNPMMAMGGMNPMMNMGMGMGPGMGPGMPGMGPAGMGMGAGGGMGPAPGGAMGGPMQGGGDPNDRFYKTKMCHKWEQGSCPYGPTCKYAHGQNDMRQPGGGGGGGGGPRGNASGKIMTPNGPAGGPGMMGMAGPMGMGPMGGAGGVMGGAGMGGGPMGGGAGGMQPRPPAGGGGGGGGGAGGGDKSHWRTRLCEGFMQKGTCRYGDKCTFAHGAHQLRAPGAGGGGMQQRNQGGGGGGSAGQKRGLEQQGGGGNDANKRQKGGVVEPVKPPLQETLPSEQRSLQAIQQKFWELQQQANAFARDTGCSVALFAVGGVLSEEPDNLDDAACCLSSVKTKASDVAVPGNAKAVVLKYATGGVANSLITRGEISKFVSQRGAKALGEMYVSQAQQAAAQQQEEFYMQEQQYGGQEQYQDQDDRASA